MRLGVLMSLASPWAREAAMLLAGTGHEVHAIDVAGNSGGYLDSSDSFQADSVRSFSQSVASVHVLRSRLRGPLRYLSSLPALRQVLRRRGADMLLTLYAGGFAMMAYLSGFRPYGVYVMGSDVLLSRGTARHISRRTLENATFVIANGEFLAEQTRLLSPAARVLPLVLGIASDRFVPGQTPSSPVRILCSRGFLPIYNNDYLLHALARIKDAGDFRVVFAAPGPLLPQAQALADSILPRETRQRVCFLGGVSPDQMLVELQRSHIYVSVSRSDGTSFSLLEALSCGLFPVLSDIAQNREWIDGENGILVPLDQPEILASALARAINDVDLRRAGAAANRKMVLQRADARQNVTVLARELERVVDRARSGQLSRMRRFV